MVACQLELEPGSEEVDVVNRSGGRRSEVLYLHGVK